MHVCTGHLRTVGQSAYICLYERSGDDPPTAQASPDDNPQYRVDQHDGRLDLFITDDDGVERQVLCYAPVGAYIPQHIQALLPPRFLRSAVVDSYVAESCLLHHNRQAFEDTMVYPRLGDANPANYQPMSSAARAVKAAVPDNLFLVMLDIEVRAGLEGQPMTTYNW